jgi:pilus assembly protein CpaD
MMKHAILCVTALTIGLSLAGCVGGVPSNRSMYSVHEPVVERVNYTLDLATGNGGVPYPEQQRLDGWFQELKLRYGDRISIEDPLQSPATLASVDAIAAHYGLDVTGGVPASAGFVEAGTTRIVVTRSKATVAGCGDWKAHSDANPANALSPNYGCATNSNLAAMVANPEHLLHGDAEVGETTIMSSNKAIGAYRAKAPSGAGDLKVTDSKGQ